MTSQVLSKALTQIQGYMKKGNQGLTQQFAEILNDLISIQDELTAKGARIKNISKVRQLVTQLQDLIQEPEEMTEGMTPEKIRDSYVSKGGQHYLTQAEKGSGFGYQMSHEDHNKLEKSNPTLHARTFKHATSTQETKSGFRFHGLTQEHKNELDKALGKNR